MFSALRNRLRVSPATVIASVALVFAMTGGAYAAKKYLITSTKQISPSVLKALQGKAGPGGAQGPAGAPGTQGPAGPAGPAGAKGDTGSAGKDGEAGAKGAAGAIGPKGATGAKGETGAPGEEGTPGATGPEGVCSTSDCHLPSGATETGSFYVKGESKENQTVPVGWAIPLTPAQAQAISANAENDIHFVGANGEGNCNGTADHPTTKNPGELCFYVAEGSGSEEGNLKTFPPGPTIKMSPLSAGANLGVSTGGALIFSGEVTWTGWIEGSFALTAP